MQDEYEKPGHVALRRFRVSRPEASYFITSNVQLRGSSGLNASGLAERVFAEWGRLENDKAWSVISGVIMPDHIHLLVQLGWEKSLSESMRLFRGRLAPVLRTADLRWQRAFYEHCLRDPKDIAPVLFYIYLNPYRARLVPRAEVWPGYFCRPKEWRWFGKLTCDVVPQPEWLR